MIMCPFSMDFSDTQRKYSDSFSFHTSASAQNHALPHCTAGSWCLFLLLFIFLKNHSLSLYCVLFVLPEVSIAHLFSCEEKCIPSLQSGYHLRASYFSTALNLFWFSSWSPATSGASLEQLLHFLTVAFPDSFWFC